jgi:hypothetical protein
MKGRKSHRTERADRVEPIGILHAVQLDARLVPRRRTTTPLPTRSQTHLIRPTHVLHDPHDHVCATVRAQIERILRARARARTTLSDRSGCALEEGVEKGACVVGVGGWRDVFLVEYVVQERA